MERKSWIGRAECVVVNVALVGGVIFAAILLPTVRSFFANEVTAAWASAIGTAAAAGVALWVADKDRRIRQQHRNFRGGMVLRIISPEIDLLLTRAVRIPAWIYRAADPKAKHHAKLHAVEQLNKFATHFELPVCRAERDNLDTLPERKAEAIARLIGAMLTVANFLRGLDALSGMDPFFWDLSEREIRLIELVIADAALVIDCPATDIRLRGICGMTAAIKSRMSAWNKYLEQEAMDMAESEATHPA